MFLQTSDRKYRYQSQCIFLRPYFVHPKSLLCLLSVQILWTDLFHCWLVVGPIQALNRIAPKELLDAVDISMT